MKRDPLHTVTFPLLVDDSNDDPPGWCSTPSGGFRAVRLLTVQEIIRDKWKILRGRDRELYEGIGQLGRAYVAQDGLALEGAVRKLHPFLPRFAGVDITEDWTGPNKWEGARWKYAESITDAIRSCQLVLWFPERRKRLQAPGVYCPDMRSAAFCALFWGAIRVCPKCKVPFVPDKKTVDYCKPSHGVAYRTALSRWNKKHN
jgi:hypothetical protein